MSYPSTQYVVPAPRDPARTWRVCSLVAVFMTRKLQLSG